MIVADVLGSDVRGSGQFDDFDSGGALIAFAVVVAIVLDGYHDGGRGDKAERHEIILYPSSCHLMASICAAALRHGRSGEKKRPGHSAHTDRRQRQRWQGFEEQGFLSFAKRACMGGSWWDRLQAKVVYKGKFEFVTGAFGKVLAVVDVNAAVANSVDVNAAFTNHVIAMRFTLSLLLLTHPPGDPAQGHVRSNISSLNAKA